MASHSADDAREKAVDLVFDRMYRFEFKGMERGLGIVDELFHAGLLGDGQPANRALSPRELVANLLHCRMSWPDAEQIADALADAGLLAADQRKEAP